MYKVKFYTDKGEWFSTAETMKIFEPDPFSIWYNTIKRTGTVKSNIKDHFDRFGHTIYYRVFDNGRDCTRVVNRVLKRGY